MFNLSKLSSAIKAETKDEKQFIKYCNMYGVASELLHKIVYSVNLSERFEVVGLRKKGRIAFIVTKKLSNNDEWLVEISKINNKKFYIFEKEED